MAEVTESSEGSHSFLERLAWVSVFLLLLAGFIDLLGDYFGFSTPFGEVGVFVSTPFFFVSGLITGYLAFDITAISIIIEFVTLILMAYRIRKLF